MMAAHLADRGGATGRPRSHGGSRISTGEPLSSSKLSDFAAFLIVRGYSSTNCYLSSVVTAEGSTVVEPLFERNYTRLRRRVTSKLTKMNLNPRKAIPVYRSQLCSLSVRDRCIALLAASVGVRSNQLSGLRLRDVTFKRRRGVLIGFALRIMIDKIGNHREVCRFLKPGRLADLLRKNYLSLFPITDEDMKRIGSILGCGLHSWRRTAAIRARHVWEQLSASDGVSLVSEVNQRQGWMASSEEFWSYSGDYPSHQPDQLMPSIFVDGH